MIIDLTLPIACRHISREPRHRLRILVTHDLVRFVREQGVYVGLPRAA